MDATVDKPPPPTPPPRTKLEPLPAGGVCGDPLRTLSCLLETVEELNSASDLRFGLERVATRLRSSIDFDTFAILLLDDRGQELRFHYALGLPEDVAAHWRFGLGQGLVGLAAATGEPLAVGDVRTDPRYIRASDEVLSEAALPLVSKSRVVGVLDVGSFQADFFSDDHLRLLKLIAGHLANAIENSRLYTNLRKQAQTLSLLHEASRELTAILNRQELLRRVGELVRRLIDYHFFNVMLWNEQEQQLEAIFTVCGDSCATRECILPLGRGLCGTAAALRQSLRVPNVEIDPRYTSCSDRGVRSELVVPLLFKDRLVGVLDLESRRYDAFSEDDEQLLSTLASYVAIALENATLYERLQQDEERLAADLETARGIQQYLLPRQTPWVPGLQIAVAYANARHLGGDLYDVLSYGEDRTAIAVGDVAGKGTAAALYGSLVIGMLRGYAAETCDEPKDVLAYLNAELRQLRVDRRFVALAFALYDRREATLAVANSGLPFPYLVRGAAVEEIAVPGVPLGAMAGVDYEQVRLELRSGDVIVLASDGIEEFLNHRGEAFGSERLREILGLLAEGSAREIADGLLGATDRFVGDGREPSDDRTVVVLKVAAG